MYTLRWLYSALDDSGDIQLGPRLCQSVSFQSVYHPIYTHNNTEPFANIHETIMRRQWKGI